MKRHCVREQLVCVYVSPEKEASVLTESPLTEDREVPQALPGLQQTHSQRLEDAGNAQRHSVDDSFITALQSRGEEEERTGSVPEAVSERGQTERARAESRAQLGAEETQRGV